MIDKSLFYKFIYVSVSFAENPNFVKNLKENFPVEIPFLELDVLNTKLKESLDSYFYIEANDKFVEIYKSICKKFPKISFTVLGSIRGKDVFSFFNVCKQANLETLQIGDYVKVLEGELKNLTAKVCGVETETVEIEFPLLNTTRNAKLHLSEILLQENHVPFKLNKFRSLEEKYQHLGEFVVLIDGNNCLLRCMHNTPDKYNSKGDYVGGFIGFFFTLLKIKEIYPEYRLHVFFQQNEIQGSEKLKKAYKMNLMWCQLFVERMGYTVYSSTEEVKDNIYSFLQTRNNIQEALIYSTNEIFMSLITPQISIYYPKITYRGNSEFITLPRINKMFGFKEGYKVKWALAFHGETEIPVKSITDFYLEKYGPKQGKIKYVEYSSLLFNATTEEELLNSVRQDSNFSLFHDTLKENLQKLTCKKIPVTCVTGLYHSSEVIVLLEEVEMYKEIELWDKTERIFRGLW